jgi:hypothetical protein
MFGWFNSETKEERRLKAARRDIAAFVAELEGKSDLNLAGLAAVAGAIRVNMEEDGVIPAGIFCADRLADERTVTLLQGKLSSASFGFQREGRGLEVAAVQVWFHTSQCLHQSELRAEGSRLWQQVARGFPHLEEAWKALRERTGKPVSDRAKEAARAVPLEFQSGISATL